SPSYRITEYIVFGRISVGVNPERPPLRVALRRIHPRAPGSAVEAGLRLEYASDDASGVVSGEMGREPIEVREQPALIDVRHVELVTEAIHLRSRDGEPGQSVTQAVAGEEHIESFRFGGA